MQELRFHGRGGQGTVLASIALAKAYFASGFYVHSFPVFGSERRGAPVEAYLKLDHKKILIRSNVYTPDHVIVLDSGLLELVDVTKGLKRGGWILINAPSLPEDLRRYSGYRLAYIDAARVALEFKLGSRTQPIINTAMLGAFARLMGEPPLDAVAAAIEEEMPRKQAENVAAARKAYNELVVVGLIDAEGAAS